MMDSEKGNFAFNDVTVTEGGRIFWKRNWWMSSQEWHSGEEYRRSRSLGEGVH